MLLLISSVACQKEEQAEIGTLKKDENSSLKQAANKGKKDDKDKKNEWTFASYDTESAVFSDRNVLPKCLIQKMEKVDNRPD